MDETLLKLFESEVQSTSCKHLFLSNKYILYIVETTEIVRSLQEHQIKVVWTQSLHCTSLNAKLLSNI